MTQNNTTVLINVNTQVVRNINTKVLLSFTMEYGERLRIARKHKKLTQQELFEQSGVPQGTISKIERGDQKTSAYDVELASALDVSPMWLKKGDMVDAPEWIKKDADINEIDVIEPKILFSKKILENDENGYEVIKLHEDVQHIEIVEWENPEDLPEEKFAIVPRVRLKLSAGNGNMITEELPGGPLAFTTEWLKRMRVKRSNLVIVNAIGDSMEPTICCGALLLIDMASKEIIDGKVYALRYGDELRVKRLYKRYDGGIIIRSDNSSKYPDETLTASDLNDHIYVIGRVIWQAGEI